LSEADQVAKQAAQQRTSQGFESLIACHKTPLIFEEISGVLVFIGSFRLTVLAKSAQY
jgi:hypothetical protein